MSVLPLRSIAIPLEAVWHPEYRSQIEVYMCLEAFAYWLPNLDTSLVRSNIQNAMEVWNAYGGADFRFVWGGHLWGTGEQCAPGGMPHADGLVVITAGNWGYDLAFTTRYYNESHDYLTRANITVWKSKWVPGGIVDIPWAFDHTTVGTYDFDTVLIHELGHVLGFPDQNDPAVASVMTRQYGPQNRVLWSEDIFRLTDHSSQYHYNKVTSRPIRKRYSNDRGLTWAHSCSQPQGTTNNRVAVAWDYFSWLVAWRDPSNFHVKTELMTFNPSDPCAPARTVTDHRFPTMFGPAAVWGNGKFVVAWVSWSDSRNIYYRTATEGGNDWSPTYVVYYNGTRNYGSMWEPSLAYNANKGLFLIAWTNWRGDVPDDDQLGRVRICTSPDPGQVAWGNCVELGITNNASPEIACHSTLNDCLITWVNPNGDLDNYCAYQRGSLDSSGRFVPYGQAYGFANCRLAMDVTYGRDYWLMGVKRGNTELGQTARMAYSSYGPFYDGRVQDSMLLVAPTVLYASGVFQFYYVRR